MTDQNTPTTGTSRNLTQDELDGFWRFDFVNGILKHIAAGHTARFVVVGSTHHRNHLATFGQKTSGEWEFSISGLTDGYTYQYSVLVGTLENVWNKAERIIWLEGEYQGEFFKPQANEE